MERFDIYEKLDFDRCILTENGEYQVSLYRWRVSYNIAPEKRYVLIINGATVKTKWELKRVASMTLTREQVDDLEKSNGQYSLKRIIEDLER